MNLDTEVVLVTGGAQGLGEAMARAYSRAGAAVVIDGDINDVRIAQKLEDLVASDCDRDGIERGVPHAGQPWMMALSSL